MEPTEQKAIDANNKLATTFSKLVCDKLYFETGKEWKPIPESDWLSFTVTYRVGKKKIIGRQWNILNIPFYKEEPLRGLDECVTLEFDFALAKYKESMVKNARKNVSRQRSNKSA